MHGRVCALTQHKLYTCFEFEEIKVHFIFPPMKGSMNACMELVGFNIPKKGKNHGARQ